MKRSSGLRRRSPIQRGGTPVKKRNAKRRTKEWARAYGSEARVQFVRSLPCIVCGNASTGPCENAHIVTGGMGRKADAKFVVPLCSPHHQSLHRRGVQEFEARYQVSLRAAAVMVQAKWTAHAVTLSVSQNSHSD